MKTHIHKKMECYFQPNFNPLCSLTSHVVSTLPNLSHYINRSQLCAIFKSILCCQKSNAFVHLCFVHPSTTYVGVIIANQQFQGCCENECQKAKKGTTKHNRHIKLQNYKYLVLIYTELLKFVRFTLFSCLRTRLRNLSRTKDYQKENTNSNRLI